MCVNLEKRKRTHLGGLIRGVEQGQRFYFEVLQGFWCSLLLPQISPPCLLLWLLNLIYSHIEFKPHYWYHYCYVFVAWHHIFYFFWLLTSHWTIPFLVGNPMRAPFLLVDHYYWWWTLYEGDIFRTVQKKTWKYALILSNFTLYDIQSICCLKSSCSSKTIISGFCGWHS